ncbi:GNAT family N-acetyltransferase [Flagellimonas sp.]|uniref:GNAT family N-acetyltransferase n=1 Tax=Flagellimonas sp. TaxID=2058762 RepID=UPI003B52D3FD
MGIVKISNYNFTFCLFKEQHVPPIYQTIRNTRTGKNYVNPDSTPSKAWLSRITEIRCIPEYLKPVPHTLDNRLKTLKINRIKGFHIDLTGFSCVTDYMNSKMGSKQRSRLKSRMKRLESCFDIRYEVYFGEIEKDRYEELFHNMQELIKRRFDQIGREFNQAGKLKALKKRAFDLILDKKASFHVIYADSRPIDICLNFHFQDILNGAIRSYDIDYAKFGLGHIDITKHVEWCLEHNYGILDFMWGDQSYKYDWCNNVAFLGHHIYYNPKSLVHRLIVPLRVLTYRFKDYKEAKKVEKQKKAARSRTANKAKPTKRPEIQEIDLQNKTNAILSEPYKEVNIHTANYFWLKPLVFNFQYQYRDHSTDITVRKLTNLSNTYLVLGKNKGIKVLRSTLEA